MRDLHVVHHHQHAAGPPVVLVHGAPDRHQNFAHVVRLVDECPITVYDRRGYGRSVDAARAPDGSVRGGFDVHADDLIDVLDGVPSVVVAQSAGGAIAMVAAAKAPELFLALGVWEPPMVPYHWWMWPSAFDATMSLAEVPSEDVGEYFNRQILGDARWEGLRDRTKAQLRAEGPAFRADMAFQREPFLELDQIRVPLLVGLGAETPAEYAAAHAELARRVGAETFVGDGADHFAHLGHPPAWAEFVRRTVALSQRA